MTTDNKRCLGITWDDKGSLRVTEMTRYEKGLVRITWDH